MAKLRPVGHDERAKPRNLTVVQAAKGGSHREMLVAMRARIAQTVEASNCPPVALAALVKTLPAVSARIAGSTNGSGWLGTATNAHEVPRGEAPGICTPGL